MVFRKLIACALAPLALFAAAPSPGPATLGDPARDHVLALAGTWSCRSAAGATARSTGVRDGNVLKVHDDVVDQSGKRSSFEDRYTFDPTQRRWHVESGYAGFRADGSPWTGVSWALEGDDVNGVPWRMTVNFLPHGNFRRSFFYGNGEGAFVLDSVELCAPGMTPPAADACIVDTYPAATLEAAQVNGRFIPANAYPGVVYVVVSLNERSEVVNVRVQSSTNPALNGPALDAARASKFRTEIVNCKPVAGDYIFSVSFGR
jgi:hypothetical protein